MTVWPSSFYPVWPCNLPRSVSLIFFISLTITIWNIYVSHLFLCLYPPPPTPLSSSQFLFKRETQWPSDRVLILIQLITDSVHWGYFPFKRNLKFIFAFVYCLNGELIDVCVVVCSLGPLSNPHKEISHNLRSCLCQRWERVKGPPNTQRLIVQDWKCWRQVEHSIVRCIF